MRVHVRHEQREIRSNTLFAVLMSWNTIFSVGICIPGIWANFIRKARDAANPLGEVESIWYGSMLLLWSACEIPRLYLGSSGNREHQIAPLLMFAVLTVVIHAVVMFVFSVVTPRGNAVDKGLTSMQLLFAFAEIALCLPMAPRMVNQNTVDFYANLWSGDAPSDDFDNNGNPSAAALTRAKERQNLLRSKRNANGGDSDDDDDGGDDNELDDIMQSVLASQQRGPGAPIAFSPVRKGDGGDDFANLTAYGGPSSANAAASSLPMTPNARHPSAVNSPVRSPELATRPAASVGSRPTLTAAAGAGAPTARAVPIAPPLTDAELEVAAPREKKAKRSKSSSKSKSAHA